MCCLIEGKGGLGDSASHPLGDTVLWDVQFFVGPIRGKERVMNPWEEEALITDRTRAWMCWLCCHCVSVWRDCLYFFRELMRDLFLCPRWCRFLKTVIFTFVKPCRVCQKSHHELFLSKLNCKEVTEISIINDWGNHVHELCQSRSLNFHSQYV